MKSKNESVSRTPTPWIASGCHVSSANEPRSHILSSMPGLPEGAANAAHICRCVNAHDELVEALQSVIATCKEGVIERRETGKPTWSALDHLKSVAENALAKATA